MLAYIILYYSINIINDLIKICPSVFYIKKIKSKVGKRVFMRASDWA